MGSWNKLGRGYQGRAILSTEIRRLPVNALSFRSCFSTSANRRVLQRTRKVHAFDAKFDAPNANIVQLFRAPYQLNTLKAKKSTLSGSEERNLLETAIVNNKLTRNRETHSSIGGDHDCCKFLLTLLGSQHPPFLFPFATRYRFLQCTSFGYARLILKWQSQQVRGGQDSSRRDDGYKFLEQLERQKVRISMKHILESVVKIFELCSSSSSVLEVKYLEEVRACLGPTSRFYALVSEEFEVSKIWRDSGHVTPRADASPFVHHESGLYPVPVGAEDMAIDRGQWVVFVVGNS
ncbi:hypothetical protein F5877DRAFT_79672 [Lentinula edodes]|nr:hypothetical protein F5877DRAFT_79672 [Lentinula edodes]